MAFNSLNDARAAIPGKNLVCGLVLFHIAIVAVANYIVQFTGVFLGYHYTMAMFVYPLVILATDLTIRLTDKFIARKIVGIAFLFAAPLSVLVVYLWSPNIADLPAAERISVAARIGIASGTAYLVGLMLDIQVFAKVREKFTEWWVAPLISTFFANIIDTYWFFAFAFVNSANEFMANNWLSIATIDLVFKILICLIVFLPAYGLLLNYLKTKLTAAARG